MPSASPEKSLSNDDAPVVERAKYATPIDSARITNAWAQRKFSCQLWIDPPGREWNDFVHTTEELVTVLEGRLEFEVGGRTLHLEPGDELWIPRNAVHSVHNVHSGTTRWLFGYSE
jgi:quercetin dioxygenase-like cupin family protein